jgi:hypothetical protein
MDLLALPFGGTKYASKEYLAEISPKEETDIEEDRLNYNALIHIKNMTESYLLFRESYELIIISPVVDQLEKARMTILARFIFITQLII